MCVCIYTRVTMQYDQHVYVYIYTVLYIIHKLLQQNIIVVVLKQQQYFAVVA